MTATWYLRKSDGSAYGPVSLDELGLWAADGRVEPDDSLSMNQEDWTPVREFSELGMTCLIRLPSGEEYGPIHRLLLAELILDGDVPADVRVHDLNTGMESNAANVALRALLQKPSAESDLRQELDTARKDYALVVQDATAMQNRLEAKIAELEQESVEMQRRMQELQQKGSGSEESAKKHEQEVRELKDEINNLKAKLDKEHKRAANLVSVKLVEERDAKWEKEIEEKEETWTQLHAKQAAELTKLQDQLKRLAADLEAAHSRAAQREPVTAASEGEVNRWREKLEKKTADWEKERAGLQSRLDMLQREAASRTVDSDSGRGVAVAAPQPVVGQETSPVIRVALSRMRTQAMQGAPELSPESRVRRATLANQTKIKPPKQKKRRRQVIRNLASQRQGGV